MFSQKVVGLSRRLIHSSALKGFSLDAAAMYNKGRADYTEAAIKAVGNLILSSGSSTECAQLGTRAIEGEAFILELGAGTGKFTIPFLNHMRSLDRTSNLRSAKYFATEPSEFLEALKSNVANYPELKVAFGTGASVPASNASVDAVVVAQAFHWMASDETLSEVNRVLKRNRPLILIWNTYDYAKADWLKQLDDEILQPHYDLSNTPRQQSYKWRDCFNSKSSKSLFSELRYWHSPTVQSGSFEVVHNRIMSTSVVAMLPESQKHIIRDKITHILNTHPQLERERRTGVIELPYVTEIAYTTAL